MTSSTDIADLQKEVTDRRDELVRMWDFQQAQKPPTGSVTTAWPNLSSRAWDFIHETYSWLNPGGQETRGRGLLSELFAMYTRFQNENIGKAAAPDSPPPPPPAPIPKEQQTPTLASVVSDAENIILIVAAVWVYSQWKNR